MVETSHSDVIGCFIWELQEMSSRRTNGTPWIHTTETSRWHTTEAWLGVSFEACLKRCGDVLIEPRHYVLLRRRHDISVGHRGDMPLRRLGDIPLRHFGCLIWDLPATSQGRTERRRYDIATTSSCWLGSDFFSSKRYKWKRS